MDRVDGCACDCVMRFFGGADLGKLRKSYPRYHQRCNLDACRLTCYLLWYFMSNIIQHLRSAASNESGFLAWIGNISGTSTAFSRYTWGSRSHTWPTGWPCVCQACLVFLLVLFCHVVFLSSNNQDKWGEPPSWEKLVGVAGEKNRPTPPSVDATIPKKN
jgi:hypothetical protein